MDCIRVLKSKSERRTLPRRPFESAKGLLTMSDNFDEPLEDFQEYL